MTAFLSIVAILGGLTTVAAFFKWVMPFARKIGHHIDDVAGEPARPGQPARPGLMERMATNEQHMANLTERVASVLQQVANSHVTNLRDDLDEVKALAEELVSGGKATREKVDELADAHAAHLVFSAAKDEEWERIVGDLAAALPIVAKSTPPNPI